MLVTMSHKNQQKKMGIRAPRSLRLKFTQWLIGQEPFFEKIGHPGYKEDVLAVMLADWMERSQDDRECALKRWLPRIAAMYEADAKIPEGAPESIPAPAVHGFSLGATPGRADGQRKDAPVKRTRGPKR